MNSATSAVPAPPTTNEVQLQDALLSLGYSILDPNQPLPSHVNRDRLRVGSVGDAERLERLFHAATVFVLTLSEDGKLHVKRGPCVPQPRRGVTLPMVYKLVNPAGLKGLITVGSSAQYALADDVPMRRSNPAPFVLVRSYRHLFDSDQASGRKHEYGLLLGDADHLGQVVTKLRFTFLRAGAPDGIATDMPSAEIAILFNVRPPESPAPTEIVMARSLPPEKPSLPREILMGDGTRLQLFNQPDDVLTDRRLFQPLAANVERLRTALGGLGHPWPHFKQPDPYRPDTQALIAEVDRRAVLILTLDAEGKLHVERGAANPQLQQHAYVPLVYKIVNPAGRKGRLTVTSSQTGPVYGGGAVNSLTRQGQLDRRSEPENASHPERVLEIEQRREAGSPSTPSGLEVEYDLLLANVHAAGKFDAKLQFTFTPDGPAAAGNVVVISRSVDFTLSGEVKPAVPVKLAICEADDTPTTARLTIRGVDGRIFPSQVKRLAPDFFFQQQIYRADGETVSLAPGIYDVEFSRGPEYLTRRRTIMVPAAAESEEKFVLERWIDPRAHGFYSGDHHIHGAGCSHYTAPTEGVSPADMFRQVKGEGLNVGAVLTWGPCYDFQRRYFSADADGVSESLTLLKYDVEVSGFGSQRLGHVCLLNLRDQTYPGSSGTVDGWPTWTIPTLRWAKQQQGVTGFAHSASGMQIVPNLQTRRLMKQFDLDGDEFLSRDETKQALLPEGSTAVDADHDGRISLFELEESHRRAVETLPNYAIPELNGPGALEICVAAAHGVCDFISSMDTARIQEWTIWYHLLNCGLPMATGGETDFPCMSGTRVGQGRTYVQLGKNLEKLNYADWCRGLAEGRSYVSDGYAHALDFAVNEKRYGETVELADSATVTVSAEVAFGSETPPGLKHGLMPQTPLSRVGNTVTLDPETERTPQYLERHVQVIVNGQVVDGKIVRADNRSHRLLFQVPIERSSWVAIRQFPQLHTNVIRVLVGGKPIRASRRSAEWCVAVVEQLWKNRAEAIGAAERPAAEQAYEEAKKFYRRIAQECRAAQLQ